MRCSLHLVCGFQLFRDLLLLCHLDHQLKEERAGLLVYYCQVAVQLASSEKIGVGAAPVLLQEPQAALAPRLYAFFFFGW